MTQSTEDMVSVRDAAEASGYTKTHIHELAKGDVIRSRMITENFRLVSLSDLMAYKRNGKAPIAKDEDDVLEQVTAQRDALLALLRRVEFTFGDMCPLCGGVQFAHKHGCELRATIDLYEEATP